MAKPKATSKARPPPKNYSETDPCWVPPSPVTGTPPKIRAGVTQSIIGSGALRRARLGRDLKWT